LVVKALEEILGGEKPPLRRRNVNLQVTRLSTGRREITPCRGWKDGKSKGGETNATWSRQRVKMLNLEVRIGVMTGQIKKSGRNCVSGSKEGRWGEERTMEKMQSFLLVAATGSSHMKLAKSEVF